MEFNFEEHPATTEARQLRARIEIGDFTALTPSQFETVQTSGMLLEDVLMEVRYLHMNRVVSQFYGSGVVPAQVWRTWRSVRLAHFGPNIQGPWTPYANMGPERSPLFEQYLCQIPTYMHQFINTLPYLPGVTIPDSPDSPDASEDEEEGDMELQEMLEELDPNEFWGFQLHFEGDSSDEGYSS